MIDLEPIRAAAKAMRDARSAYAVEQETFGAICAYEDDLATLLWDSDGGTTILSLLAEIEALLEVAEKAREITEYSAMNAMDRWQSDGHTKSPEYSAMIGASREALARLDAIQKEATDAG